MYWIFMLTALLSADLDCDNLNLIRSEFHKVDSEISLTDYIAMLENTDCEKIEPYLASSIMRQAEFDFSPIKKLDHFYEGKIRLEQFISEHPSDIEARYLRILVQNNSPSLLLYKDNIEEDVKFIRTNIDHSDIPSEYKELIIGNISKL